MLAGGCGRGALPARELARRVLVDGRAGRARRVGVRTRRGRCGGGGVAAALGLGTGGLERCGDLVGGERVGDVLTDDQRHPPVRRGVCRLQRAGLLDRPMVEVQLERVDGLAEQLRELRGGDPGLLVQRERAERVAVTGDEHAGRRGDRFVVQAAGDHAQRILGDVAPRERLGVVDV